MSSRATDRGSITPYTIIFILILMLFIGLAVDGSGKLRAVWEATGAAEESARAGAGQLDRAAAYEGKRLVVDRGAAVRAAQSYLTRSGHTGSVKITGPTTIAVSVSVTKRTWLLWLAGLTSVSATSTATADLISGVEGPNR